MPHATPWATAPMMSRARPTGHTTHAQPRLPSATPQSPNHSITVPGTQNTVGEGAPRWATSGAATESRSAFTNRSMPRCLAKVASNRAGSYPFVVSCAQQLHFLPASPCLPTLAPIEKCRDSPRNARGTVTMSVTGVHPALPGDMHGRVRVWLGVGLTGEALRLLHVHSMYEARQGRSRNRTPGPLKSARTAAVRTLSRARRQAVGGLPVRPTPCAYRMRRTSDQESSRALGPAVPLDSPHRPVAARDGGARPTTSRGPAGFARQTPGRRSRAPSPRIPPTPWSRTPDS